MTSNSRCAAPRASRRWWPSGSPPAAAAAARRPTTPTGGGGNAAGSSGYTIAFITHETPGDTFWDKIKAGAQQAAKDTGVTLKYSNDPDADQAGRADPERGRLQGRRHRHHAGHPGRAGRRGEGGHRREDPGGRLQLRHRPVQEARRADVLRLRRDPGRHRRAGERIAEAGAKHPLCVIQAGRLGRPRGPLRRRQERGPRHREHPGQRRRRRGRDVDAAGEAVAGQVDRLHRHPGRPDRRWTR